MYLDYFPYESLRPNQDRMLDAVYDTVSKGEHRVLMIDAPTGTGKTSCISAALAAAPGKIVVAVRTVSQIDIYIDEIRKIRSRTRHSPEIAYMVGKQKVCPLEEEFRNESVYAGCSQLKEWTKSYVASRLNRTKECLYDPAADGVPDEEPGHRTICPYFLRSREAFEMNGKVHFRRSGRALDVVETLKKTITPPAELAKSCHDICPYEVMSLYAQNSEMVIMNYSHLFSPDFQDIIFQWLEIDQEKVTLIVDEAHNLGDAVRAMSTRVLTARMLDLSEREVEKFEGTLGQARLEESREGASWRREGIKVIRTLLPRLKRFLASRQERGQEGEDLLDADLFRSFLYDGIKEPDEALSYFSDIAVAVADLNLAEGDRENLQGDLQPSLAQVLLFLRDAEQAEKDDALQRKIVVTSIGNRRHVRLEVNNIDPAPAIRRVTDNVNATVMFSGTFSPLEAYELYCLGEENHSEKLCIPNPFPKENRLLLVASRATTQLESREDADNREEIAGHIRSVIEEVPGNVAIFFTSYPMMNNYRETCRTSAHRADKELLLEPRSADEVAGLLDDFFRAGEGKGAVLMGVCGGKLAEGIDYRGNALNGVAVVGLPLAAYDDIQKEINAYYTRKYGKTKGMLIAYTLPAINRGLQAAGRVIRAESERGVLLFCDRRFGSVSGGVNQFLPEWVRGELIEADSIEGRRLIQQKVKEWGTGGGQGEDVANNGKNILRRDMSVIHREKSAQQQERGDFSQGGDATMPPKKRTKSARDRKRDLRELARSLGLEKPVSEKGRLRSP